MKKELMLENLSVEISKAAETGKIEPSIFKTLDTVIKSCSNAEKFWAKKEDVSKEASFALYHASRNSRIILEKMEKRFKEAASKKENPIVAVQSVKIIPELSGICDLIISLKKVKISSSMVTFIMSRVRDLRNTAREVDMLPSPEEEIQKVDKKILKQHFGKFVDSLQEFIY